MGYTPKDQKPVWVRGGEEFQERINNKVKAIGMKKADWLAGVIKYGLDHEDPLFFINRGTENCRPGKRKHS